MKRRIENVDPDEHGVLQYCLCRNLVSYNIDLEIRILSILLFELVPLISLCLGLLVIRRGENRSKPSDFVSRCLDAL